VLDPFQLRHLSLAQHYLTVIIGILLAIRWRENTTKTYNDYLFNQIMELKTLPMAHQNASHTIRILITLNLTLLLFLTACSGGNVPSNNSTLKDAALDLRQPQSNSAQELPKAAAKTGNLAESANPAAPELPAQAVVPQESPALPAPSGGAPQGAEAVDPAAAAAAMALPTQPRVGARAPEFTLQTLDGQAVHLSELVGRPIVISYWATWCIPCQKELPILEQLYREYQSQGLLVLTVNAIGQDSLDKVQAMVSEKAMTLPVLLDNGDQFADAYEALFLPTTYYIDAYGVIRFIKMGDSTEADLRAHVEDLLAGDL